MTFLQHLNTAHGGRLWFRLVAGGLLTALVAACVVIPVGSSPQAPALNTVQPNVAIGVGQEKDLLPFVRLAGTDAVPFNPLQWEVSNSSLLYIDPRTGRAKGLAAGTVVVKVTDPSGGAGGTQFIIEVVGEDSPAVQSITVKPARHHMVVGEAVLLRADVVMPDGQVNGNVAWSSSDDTLARVNPTTGGVSALKPGRVTIVAAYAAAPAFKGLAEIFVYATRAEIPPSPTPAPSVAVVPPPATPSNSSNNSPPRSSSGSGGGSLQPPPPAPAAPPVVAPPSPVAPAVSTTPSVAPSAPPLGLASVTVTTLAGSTSGYADGPLDTAKFSAPQGVALDAMGNLYITDVGNGRIRKVSAERTATTVFDVTQAITERPGVVNIASLNLGIAVEASGSVYWADYANHCLRRVSPEGAITTLRHNLSYPTGIAFDAAGNLYMADTGNHRIRKMLPNGSIETLAGSTAGYVDSTGAEAKFMGPKGIAVDAAGNLYVTDASVRIRKVSPTGRATTLAGSTQGYADGTGAEAQFRNLEGIAVDAAGNVYVADMSNNCIRKVSPEGVVTTLAGSTKGFADGTGAEAQFDWPLGVAVDAAGNIYVADTGNHRIRKITVSP